jgi:predicted dehydrogenase
MNILSAIGVGKEKVRYAVVGLGDIAQEAMMRGVDHTGNSTIAALVSGGHGQDAEKLTRCSANRSAKTRQ